MKLRKTLDTYIILKEDSGYIANPSLRKMLSVRDCGLDFLRELTKDDIDEEKCIENLSAHFDVGKEVLAEDFHEFVRSLISEGLIEESLAQKEPKIPLTMPPSIPQIERIEICLTKACNERCVHCYLPNSLKAAKEMLPIDIAKRLVAEFVEMGGSKVSFTGGEIFVYPYLEELLRYCATQVGIDVEILSNGTLIGKDEVCLLKKYNVKKVQISLYSVIESEHDYITQRKGSCAKTKRCIEDLVKAGLDVVVSTPIMKVNYSSLPLLYNYVNHVGAILQFNHNLTARIDGTTDNLNMMLSETDMENFYKIVCEEMPETADKLLRPGKNDFDRPEVVFDYLNSGDCSGIWLGLYITSNGKVSVCPNWENLKIGDCSQMSLNEIWNKNANLQMIRGITHKSNSKCLHCQLSDYCQVCPVISWTECNHSFTEIPKSVCRIAEIRKRVYNEYKDRIDRNER